MVAKIGAFALGFSGNPLGFGFKSECHRGPGHKVQIAIIAPTTIPKIGGHHEGMLNADLPAEIAT